MIWFSFLSGAYIMVNEDAGTFTLWQATDSLDENLVAVDEHSAVKMQEQYHQCHQ
jgi:hypothetical protein